LAEFESPQNIFSQYAYFSSYSETLLSHSKNYTDMVVDRFNLDASSQVVEIASNDGYLLQYFKQKGIQVLGVEPAENVAKVAVQSGIPTVVAFFGENTSKKLAADGKNADLMIGNNVLAHVPDLNDFVQGYKNLLKAGGVITIEFPHLLRLIENNQFDTIYHEHFSYFSLLTVKEVFSHHGLNIFDVDEISTHGGSLRIYACHSDDPSKPTSSRVSEIIDNEINEGLKKLEYYTLFSNKVKDTKLNILNFLIDAKKNGKSVAGYGAPAKANTLLNYCGIRTDFIDYTVDRSPHKQGMFLPGTRVPICHPDKIKETKPDYVIVFPWNILEEIMTQMAHIRQWDGKFVVLIPNVKVY
jgi:2-polyprenyl-3-methyl-5-hydroxy-6-metoxy-1,4-benzoquinol methylase